MEVKQLHIYKCLWIFICSLGLASCVEEFDFVSENFEDILIIDATITDEMKHHEVFLSRTFRFEDKPDAPESGAVVTLLSENTTIVFSEIEPGHYASVDKFRAQPNTAYQLQINTAFGRSYRSENVQLTPEVAIDALYAEREVNSTLGDGISLFIDSYDATGDAKYFRYGFEETYKIIAPFWRSEKVKVIANDFPKCEVALEKRPDSVRVCYKTQPSDVISVASTATTSENRIRRHRVHFLSNQNAKISHRYSMLAIQYVQTQQANNYYKTLLEFNQNESLFSQVQGGYIQGNYTSETNKNEKVIGFFEVASVAKKRIFFNYEDFYDGEPLPPYFVDCYKSAPQLFGPIGSMRCGPLPRLVEMEAISYLKDNDGEFKLGGPYIMLPRTCGNCTTIGDVSPPEFWIE
ncbi:DUF4249 domain-containing protein [Rasiella rasia]|uniref:DUF4249 domain-containing protein n=1 Tax=Rasiella rasia TaxID=2744027 RepID=A0A6G6GI77_9FLAO|nr:DUF4249 domain-containing protein [Rasiella rasia]QIE58210.1 DUF4249 domain-containing protein [Rasiella rasia]